MKISIITINFNNKKGLVKTIASVKNQSYSNIEYIVIDGASTDGSAEYLSDQSKDFNYWISEPDRGIYHAMNKGIDRAVGDYLLFLNSGDTLTKTDVIDKFARCDPKEDIIYGNVLYMYPDGTRRLREFPSIFNSRIVITDTLNHQSIFFKRELFSENNMYDESYTLLADWVFYSNEILFKSRSSRHINLIVAEYNMDGASSSTVGKELMESERIKFYNQHPDFFFKAFIDEFDAISKKYQTLIHNPVIKILFKTTRLVNKIYFGLKK